MIKQGELIIENFLLSFLHQAHCRSITESLIFKFKGTISKMYHLGTIHCG